MSIENEIADLTQSTTDLLNAVNTKKATLDTAVSNAETAVTDATSQVSLAAAEKVGAQTARDTAETFKDQAYTYSQSAASAVAYQDLTAIAQTKVETATDVFVYDTSKDSDGGAWRKRTQHTSWYNETLNTATRGSRKEFPAVAVIVAEVDKVTIYDGDDPSLPMWMVFNRLHAIKDMLGRRDSVSVQSINGLLCVVASDAIVSGGYAPLIKINFISDVVKHTNNVGTYTFKETISEREAAVYSSDSAGDTDYWIVSEGSLVSATLNDVAMTVLPNAPIDPDTGLPIPTIAVATDGGVSVIKDDGSVVDITGYVYRPRFVIFDEDSQLYSTGNYWDKFVVGEIPDSDILVTALGATYNWTDLATKNGAFMYNFVTTDKKQVASNTTNSLYSLIRADVSAGTTEGLLSNITTSSYNTGWMNGDIKLATLSDTDDTDLVGTELVTNGTFDSDTSGWTAALTTISSVSGELIVTGNGSNSYGSVYQDVPTVVGKTYVLSFDFTKTLNNLILTINGTDIVTYTSSFVGGAAQFTATSNTTRVQFKVVNNASGELTIDNVSLRLAEPDRSVNNNGLQVFGTVTKEPVATGADLVAYSGSADNRLVLPASEGLNFGLGDFCITAWAKQVNGDLTIIYNGDGTSYVPANGMHFWLNGGYLKYSMNTGHRQVSTPSGSNEWALYHIVRKDGIIYLYQNGVLFDTADESTKQVTSTNDALILDGFYNNTINNGLALLRISGTAPTAEQIAKIYRDEKVLFQEGAQATLHGTSDAVTALAYDDSTELLHVGTSAGRSVFSGLQRVDNTTDAVGVAISASDNFIVEE